MIIIDSHKVYPSEVEKNIMQLSDIKECAAVRLEGNDNEFIGCLYIGEKVNECSIREMLKTKLLPYEIPRIFLKCEKLPRTKNGKISSSEIQDYFKNI